MFALHYTNATGMNTKEETVGLHFRCNSWLSTVYIYLRNLPLYKPSSSISFWSFYNDLKLRRQFSSCCYSLRERNPSTCSRGCFSSSSFFLFTRDKNKETKHICKPTTGWLKQSWVRILYIHSSFSCVAVMRFDCPFSHGSSAHFWFTASRNSFTVGSQGNCSSLILFGWHSWGTSKNSS